MYSQITPEQALEIVREKFPFENYIGEDVSPHLNIARTVMRHLKPEARILDFGSGPCDRTGVLQELGYQCAAMDDLQDGWHSLGDNRKRILAFAKDLGINFKVGSDPLTMFGNESFDMVMMHHVLEHLHNSPRELSADLVELLRPGGFFYLTVPNLVNIRKRLDVLRGRTNLPAFDTYYWYPGSWRGHIREYTKGDLARLSRNLDLDIVELGSCHHMLGKVPTRLRPAYMAITRVFPGWRDSWSLVAKKPANWKPKRSLSEDELAALMSMYTRYQH
jgi:SAM-dependent methyltransferase